MFSMIWPGALAAQAVYCAAQLAIADHLAEGTDRVDSLSTVTQTHPVALRRLLRALCSLEILKECADGRFELTEMGETLRKDDASGVQPWVSPLKNFRVQSPVRSFSHWIGFCSFSAGGPYGAFEARMNGPKWARAQGPNALT